MVLRLVRKDCHQQAGQVKLSNARSGLVGPHKRAVASSKEELGIDKRTEQRVAGRSIEAPQPLGLCSCQSQAGHFDVFPLNASNHLVKRLLCSHGSPAF